MRNRSLAVAREKAGQLFFDRSVEQGLLGCTPNVLGWRAQSRWMNTRLRTRLARDRGRHAVRGVRTACRCSQRRAACAGATGAVRAGPATGRSRRRANSGVRRSGVGRGVTGAARAYSADGRPAGQQAGAARLTPDQPHQQGPAGAGAPASSCQQRLPRAGGASKRRKRPRCAGAVPVPHSATLARLRSAAEASDGCVVMRAHQARKDPARQHARLERAPPRLTRSDPPRKAQIASA